MKSTLHILRTEGETLQVPLVDIGGRRRIHGGNCIVDGNADESRCQLRQTEILEKLVKGRFLHQVIKIKFLTGMCSFLVHSPIHTGLDTNPSL